MTLRGPVASDQRPASHAYRAVSVSQRIVSYRHVPYRIDSVPFRTVPISHPLMLLGPSSTCTHMPSETPLSPQNAPGAAIALPREVWAGWLASAALVRRLSVSLP